MVRFRSKTLRRVVLSQVAILVLFVAMTIGNEILDLPHFLLGDTATSFDQRIGEAVIELVILTLIIGIELVLITKLYRRIRILEGFLPICANCKRIRHDGRWDQIETYISKHSRAEFTHSICPDCVKELYPDFQRKGKG